MADNWWSAALGNPNMRRVAGDALSDFGYGLATAPTFGDAFGAAAQQGARLAPYRNQMADQRAERQRQLELASQYGSMLRGWGPEFEELAAGVEAGAIPAGQGFFHGLEMRQTAQEQARDRQRNAANAQFLTDPQLRGMVESGALDFADAYRYQQQGTGDGVTDTQRNLEWRAREAGLAPGTPEYMEFMRSGGSGGMSIEMGPDGTMRFQQGGGGRFNQTVDVGGGQMYNDLQQQALNAHSALNTFGAMEQMMADPAFYSGFGADQVMGLKRMAAAVGIDPDGVSSMETFMSMSNQAVLAQMGGSLGQGFSNADRDFVVAQMPQLANTPEGNRQLLEILRGIERRKIEVADLAQQYRQANGNLDGFVQFLGEWAEANPLFASGEGAVDMGGGVTIRQVR